MMPRPIPPIARSICVGIVAAALLLPGVSAESARITQPRAGDDLDQVLARFDEAQNGVRTLVADFTETREIGLLKDPVVSSGRLFYTRPEDILWEYAEPSTRFFLIRRNELLAYYPDENRAERVDISRYHGRLMKLLGIGQVSKDLRKFYDISIAETDGSGGTRDLVLTPRRKRVRKRVEEVRFWLDAETYLPVRVRYDEEDGDSTTLTFGTLDVNAAIDESTYRLELPDGLTVEDSFSGFSTPRGAS